MPEAQTASVDERRISLAVLIASGGLISFGVMLWVAANWNLLDKFVKFSLVGGASLAGALTAMALPVLRIPGALVAFAGIGGLFALFGQVYQSGADPWQLFALWAALGLPLALAARHDALFVPWTVVCFTGIGLWLTNETNHFDRPLISMTLSGWGLALAVIALLLVIALPNRPARPTLWATRLAVIMATMLVVGTGIGDLFALNGNHTIFLLALIVMVAGTLAAGLATPFELSLLAVLALGVDVLLIAGIIRILSNNPNDFISSLLLVFVVSAGVLGATASLLLKWNARRSGGGNRSGTVAALDWVRRRGAPATDDSASSPAGGMTWPITVLSGIGALIAMVPLVLFFFSIFRSALENGPTVYFLSAMLIFSAVQMLRMAKSLSFTQQFGFILLVSGLSLCGFGLLRDFSNSPEIGSAVLLALTLAIARILPIGWIRNLLGAAGAFASLVLISAIIGRGDAMLIRFEQQFFGAMVVAIIAAGLIWHGRRADGLETDNSLLLSYSAGFAPAALGALIVTAGPTFLLGNGFGTLEATRAFGVNISAFVAPALSIAATIGGAALLLRERPALRNMLTLTVAAVLAALSVFVTTLGFAVLILSVALIANRRILAGYAAMAGLWIIGSIYYSLAWPLDTKGFALIGLGLVLGVVALMMRRRRVPAADIQPAGLRSALAAGLIGLSTLGTAGVFASALTEKEAILRQGETVFIGLVPVDPRSIVQGDYMALRFAMPDGSAVFKRASAENRTPLAIATIDSRRVATITRLDLPTPQLTPGERMLKMRRERGTWRIGTNAWFFREGEGAKYEDAKFGEFKLGPAGDLILVGMADKDLKPIR